MSALQPLVAEWWERTYPHTWTRGHVAAVQLLAGRMVRCFRPRRPAARRRR